MKIISQSQLLLNRSNSAPKPLWVMLSFTVLLMLSSQFTLAIGTQAGTSITNNATISYSVAGNTVTQTTNQVSIVVQELVSANLVIQHTGDIAIRSPFTEASIKVTLTNIGNGDEAYYLTQSNISASDDFDVTIGNIYLDDGDDLFEPGTEDILYSPVEISPDSSITLWVTSDIPDLLLSDQKADVSIKAISKTFEDDGQSNPQPGDLVIGAGTNGTDAVASTSGSILLETATFIISTVSVTIDKSILGTRDSQGTAGAEFVTGTEVDYRLTVTAIGNGTATNVTVFDPLPDELLLKDMGNGEIIVNGIAMSAQANAIDGDSAFYDENNNSLTIEIGDLSAGEIIEIDFTAVIQ